MKVLPPMEDVWGDDRNDRVVPRIAGDRIQVMVRGASLRGVMILLVGSLFLGPGVYGVAKIISDAHTVEWSGAGTWLTLFLLAAFVLVGLGCVYAAVRQWTTWRLFEITPSEIRVRNNRGLHCVYHQYPRAAYSKLLWRTDIRLVSTGDDSSRYGRCELIELHSDSDHMPPVPLARIPADFPGTKRQLAQVHRLLEDLSDRLGLPAWRVDQEGRWSVVKAKNDRLESDEVGNPLCTDFPRTPDSESLLAEHQGDRVVLRIGGYPPSMAAWLLWGVVWLVIPLFGCVDLLQATRQQNISTTGFTPLGELTMLPIWMDMLSVAVGVMSVPLYLSFSWRGLPVVELGPTAVAVWRDTPFGPRRHRELSWTQVEAVELIGNTATGRYLEIRTDGETLQVELPSDVTEEEARWAEQEIRRMWEAGKG